jgi:hypothetical protein
MHTRTAVWKRLKKKTAVDLSLSPSLQNKLQKAGIVPTLLTSGSLNLQEPSGPHQACTKIALPYRKRDLPSELVGMVAREGKDEGWAASNVNVTTRRH